MWMPSLVCSPGKLTSRQGGGQTGSPEESRVFRTSRTAGTSTELGLFSEACPGTPSGPRVFNSLQPLLLCLLPVAEF